MPNALFLQLGPFFSSGALVTSPKLYHYSAGTTTDKNIWSDRSESTTLAQPFVGDANGIFNFFADGLYKFVIKDSSDNTLYTLDNVLVDDLSAPSLAEGASIASASTTVLGDEVFAHITGTTTIDALSGSIPFFWAVFDGSLTLTHSSNLLCPGSVDLTVQSGDVLFFLREDSAGTIWRVSGQVPNSFLVNRTDVSVVVSDSRTNTVDAPLTVTSTTSGTPAAGIGTGILFRAESQDENPSNFGQLQFIANDVGTGTEDTFFSVMCRVAGAALTQIWAFVATGAFTGTIAHANSADRTYTFQNANYTVIGRDTTDTLTNKTLSGAVVTGTSSGATTANVLYTDSIVKGWVKFNVAGTIDDSLNVSSITDNGAGDWTVNWATDFADANYAWSGSVKGEVFTTGAPLVLTNRYSDTYTAAALQVVALSTGGTPTDPVNAGDNATTNSRITVMAIGNQ